MKRLIQFVAIFALAITVVVTPLSAEVCPVAKDGQDGGLGIAATRLCLPRMMCCLSTTVSSGVLCVGPRIALMGFVRQSIEAGSIAFPAASFPTRTGLNPHDFTCSASGPGIEGSPGSSPLAYLCNFRL
jgi:hypothetical protein